MSRVYTALLATTWTMISPATVLSGGRANDARRSYHTATLTPARTERPATTCLTTTSAGRCYQHTAVVFFLSVDRGCSVVECRTRNQMSPGSNPPLLPFRRLGIFVLSIDAPVDSAVKMSTWL